MIFRVAAIGAKAIECFKGPDYVYPGYSYAPWTELARLLASLAPRPLTTCFRATGGSEAVDLALQAAMIHTGGWAEVLRHPSDSLTVIEPAVSTHGQC
jgi:4-aminobutyrate aminotransferase-like enzyme